MMMSKELPNFGRTNQIQRLYFALSVFAASFLAAALVTVHNNSARSLPIFVFLLFLGAGIMLTLGIMRGALAGLLIISIWIAAKQLLGVWDEIRLINNLSELIVVGLTFVFCGVYQRHLQSILDSYREYQHQLKQLDLEDKSVGLIKPAIGLLRLTEEEERSFRYRRPFALILIVIQPLPGFDLAAGERSELMRAVATSIKDTTRDTDIPFLAENDRIAIILPETETNGANKVVNNIFNRMIITRFVTPSGDSILIQKRVQLRFGFAAFLGEGSSKANMMEAAEQSLKQSQETNTGDLFQNLFIEWVTLGKQPSRTPLFGKVV